MEDFSLEFQLIKDKNLLVIVEGKKDKLALEEFGITKVVTLNKPLFEIVESVCDKEVVVLTDLDREGRKLYSRLKRELGFRGIKVNDKLREKLFENKVCCVESLTKVLNI